MRKIHRILDVNMNRSLEGLRVVEEVCRFVLEDRGLTAELKEIRGKLGRMVDKLIENEFHFQQRKALRDIGKGLYTPGEAKRKTIQDIFVANAKRAQEAIRVLEEFSKLIKPGLGKSFKEIRFEVYDLEKRIFYALRRRTKLDFDLYVVTDPMRDHVEAAKLAIAGGIKIIQLRDKKAAKKHFLKWAKKISKMAKEKGAAFIVNDYIDIAKRVGAEGVHLGQEDMPVRKARKLLGDDKIIGVSTHSFAQALKAEKDGADYISVGPVFRTPSKPRVKPVGLSLLQKVINRVKVPVVAIGGINESNIGKVNKAGCQRTAVIRAVLGKKNMKEALKRLRYAAILRK